MKKAAWFVGITIVASTVFMGCLPDRASPEQESRIAALETRIIALAASNEEAVEKFRAGTLTAAEFKDVMDKNLVEGKALRDEVKDLKASGLTTGEIVAYGATGGVLGRTLMHGAAKALPLIPAGPFQPLLGILGSILTMLLQSKSSTSEKKGA